MASSPSISTPKYGATVVGKRCWIRFIIDDNSKAWFGGTIESFHTSTDTSYSCDGGNNVAVRHSWYHVIHFDDREMRLDLDFEERNDNLYWTDPTELNVQDVDDDTNDELLSLVEERLENHWVNPAYKPEEASNRCDKKPATKRNAVKKQKRTKKRKTTNAAAAQKNTSTIQKDTSQDTIETLFGAESVGQQVMVHWTYADGDEDWIIGTITEYYNRSKPYHIVKYLDGTSVWHDAFKHGEGGLRFVV